MSHNDLTFLRLLQLADSALPIGSTAHSFGLETLTVEGDLPVERLEAFLRVYLEEASIVEAVFCRLAYHLARSARQESFSVDDWLALNRNLGAFKTARESRNASAVLGRRLLQLTLSLETSPVFSLALQSAKTAGEDIHHSVAFGLIGGYLECDESAVILAYLHQSLSALISACQRLLPLGQSQASSLLWHLKPTLLQVATNSAELVTHPEELTISTPLLDLASMRHPTLETRLFIS